MKQKERAVCTSLCQGDDGYRGYALFRSDTEEGTVAVAHVADPTLVRGESFWKRTHLSSKKIAKLRETLLKDGITWISSALGVGILFSEYDLWMGLFLYIHVHDDPEGLRESLAAGEPGWAKPRDQGWLGSSLQTACGAGDEAVRQRLALRMDELHRVHLAALALEGDRFMALSLVETLVDAVAGLIRCPIRRATKAVYTAAVSVGAGAHATDTEEVVRCHVPHVIAGAGFYWLGLMREMAIDGAITYEVSCVERDGASCLRLCFEAEVEEGCLANLCDENRKRLLEMDHVAYRQELNGVRTSVTADEASCTEGRFRLAVSMIFQRHPAKDPPAAFKTDPTLIYD